MLETLLRLLIELGLMHPVSPLLCGSAAPQPANFHFTQVPAGPV
jgi:hypothetical protein